MARYIDAEPLEKKFAALYDKAYRIGAHPSVIADRMDYLQDIQLAPTEDVAPVKHGKWIDNGANYKCSICGNTASCYSDSYCPSCGVKMDEE